MIADLILIYALVHVTIGFYFVTITRSRGLWADASFIVIWPLIAWRDWRGW
jgi:hypothetical protein